MRFVRIAERHPPLRGAKVLGSELGNLSWDLVAFAQHRGRSSGTNWDTTETKIQLGSFPQNVGFGNGGKGNSFFPTDSDII